KNPDKVTDAELLPIHQVKQPQASAVRQRTKEYLGRNPSASGHRQYYSKNIYVLTYMSRISLMSYTHMRMRLEENMNIEVKALKAHLAINVKNVEQSPEFYRKMFGIEPSKVRKGYAKFDVSNPSLNFTLNEVAFAERGALSHMGIQVGSTEENSHMGKRATLGKCNLVEGEIKRWIADIEFRIAHMGIQVGSTEEVLAVRQRW